MKGMKNDYKILIKDWHMLLSIVVTTSFKNNLNYLKTGSINWLIKFLSFGMIVFVFLIFSGMLSIQLSNKT